MSSERRPADIEQKPPLPQEDFADTPLTAELEPTADGGQRALVYPSDGDDAELATRWLAVPEALLVDLEDVQ